MPIKKLVGQESNPSVMSVKLYCAFASYIALLMLLLVLANMYES